MSSGDQLNVSIDEYRAGLAAHDPPPGITSDVAPGIGLTPVDQWMNVLVAAANAGDLKDATQSTEEHAQREAKMNEAVEKFSAQDQEATQAMTAVGQQADPALAQAATPAGGASAAAQQMPQAASSIAGALAGAIGGALQPLAQIPQQVAQGAQQVMQTGMGLIQQAGGAAAEPIEDASLALDPLAADLADVGAADLGGVGADDLGGAGGADLAGIGGAGGADTGGVGGGGGFGGGTMPVSTLGPPPIPSASTAPSSSPITQITPPPSTSPSPHATAGMGGMPMVPPGALAGGASSEKDAKADTKRVSVPPVRNGAPVQGRLAAPPPLPPVVKKEDGSPVVTRRVVVPRKLKDEDPGDATSDR